MLKLSKALLYVNTMRYLRPVQIYGRLWRDLYKPKPGLSPPPEVRPALGASVQPAPKYRSLHGPSRFRFLNEEHDILSPADWNHAGWADLWLYNLHYFDDLNAPGADARGQWHRSLLARWVSENPPGEGIGWDPYPTSLRIVNWIKWVLAGNELPADCVHSLAVQARWLRKRLEWHILGNHLLANAKALVFAGCFFEGAEADAMRAVGLRILDGQLDEQVMPDGGHFELSPMYHALVLEDVLDLMNLQVAYPELRDIEARRERWKDLSFKMLRWLAVMTHPDGEISFFNDAAFGMAPPPAELNAYARRLGLRVPENDFDTLEHLENSGYLRLHGPHATALLDCAAIGPDYLPGHAHADTLSFELSVGRARLLVNSGTSCYGKGKERLRQRGTKAHNTVVVDGQDFSEVWAGFRVARRAYPTGPAMARENGEVAVSCSHDGYRRLPGKPSHRRKWLWRQEGLVVEDRVAGNFSHAEARFHVHPQWTAVYEQNGRGVFRLKDRTAVRWWVERGFPRLEPTTFHPEFGQEVASQCLAVALADGLARVHFEWQH